MAKKYTEEMIKDLNIKVTETKKCTDCEQTLSTIDNFSVQIQDGKYYFTSNCNKCRSKKAVIYQRNKKIKNPLEEYTKTSWKAVNQRSTNGVYSNTPAIKNSPQMASYHRKGILLEISKEEWIKFWKDNEQVVLEIIENKLIPSVDRIDTTKNYSLDNIRIISREKNMMIRFSTDYENIEDKEFKNIVNPIDSKIRENNRLAYLKSQNQGEK